MRFRVQHVKRVYHIIVYSEHMASRWVGAALLYNGAVIDACILNMHFVHNRERDFWEWGKGKGESVWRGGSGAIYLPPVSLSLHSIGDLDEAGNVST